LTQSEEKSRHDRTVALVAQQEFSYPNTSNPDLQTCLNEPTHIMGIKTSANPIYPDIVVVDKTKNVAVMIGEIETEMTINAAGAGQWRTYSGLCGAFYLYVPASAIWETRNLLTSNGTG
jgi:hypothetical protein